MKAIDLISQKPIQGITKPNATANTPGSDNFRKVLFDSINKVNDLQIEADRQIEALSKGEQKDIHRTMISMEKASVSFDLMMQIRNKVIEAYDEIRRMPI